MFPRFAGLNVCVQMLEWLRVLRAAELRLRPLFLVFFIEQFEHFEGQLTAPGAGAIRSQDRVVFELPGKNPDSLNAIRGASSTTAHSSTLHHAGVRVGV
jgi:hypothetical protein